ncbi:hypothetical protein [Streptomyces chartreusis]|uniref:hypothetical protein n=1 Tax=Streptomyces chartreusis TaxID=1969 RepID=UPI0033DFC15C
MTPSQLQALACEDCPADIRCTTLQGLNGPVLTVVITHEPTCPWLARVAPEGATLVRERGIVRHTARTTA